LTYVEVYGWIRSSVDLINVLDVSTFETSVTYCDPEDATIAASRRCEFPMSLFTDIALAGIADGDVIPFAVAAVNQYGNGVPSDLNTAGAFAYSKPAKPLPVVS